MGAIHRFLAIGDEAEQIVEWFRQLPEPPQEIPTSKGCWLYFQAYGNLVYHPESGDGQKVIAAENSPLVSYFPPLRKRGVLWTAGEVHFLPTPLSKICPPLNAVSRKFRKWLSEFDLVFSRKRTFAHEWDYFLEGSIRNHDPDLFALPIAMEALRKGQYFVAESDNDWVLEKVCRELRKRGVIGIAETRPAF